MTGTARSPPQRHDVSPAATPFHFLPVLLLLVAIPLVSDGLHQVGMARMAGAVFTPAPGDAEEMDGALSQVSFFPPGFHPVPRRDRRLVDPSDDPDEIIFFYELIQEDLFHHPLVYNLGLELFTGLRLSHYATHGFIIGESERQPLLQYRREQEKNKKMRAASNPNIRGRSTRPPLLPPREVFPRLTRGDYLGDEGMEPPLMPLMDRYFVHQMELQLVHNRFCDIFVELMHVPHRPPLVITMFNWMVSRFGLRCVFFRTHALKTATRKFVILASQGDNAASNNFFLDEVLAHPHYNLTYLLNHPLLAHWYGINGNLGHPKFSRTPQGIRPHHISGASLIQFSSQNAWQYAAHNKDTMLILQGLDLNAMFPHIHHPLVFGRQGAVWLEHALELFAGGTADPPIQWIPLDQLPERVNTIYLVEPRITKPSDTAQRPSLTHEILILKNDLRKANRAAQAAQHIALLPFTAALYHKLQQHPHGEASRELKVLTAFTVWDWRKSVWEYLKAPEMEALTHFLPNTMNSEFVRVLNNFTFVMSPPGFGYDCFRTWEAIIYGAIPILQNPAQLKGKIECVGGWQSRAYGHEVDSRHFLELFDGLPVVVIDSVSEINKQNLILWRAQVFNKASRGEYQLEKLFSQSWIDRIYSHTNED